jgi:hypothetical protein
MPLRHAVDQFRVSFCHVLNASFEVSANDHEMLLTSASPAPARTISPTRLPNIAFANGDA